ncbi:MAG: enoyl-CoA hydratase-related protein [Rubrivivax sp.]
MDTPLVTDFFSVQALPSGIAHLRLNRPERMNTMTPAFFRRCATRWSRLTRRAPRACSCCLRKVAHFSAGMALDVFAGAGDLASLLATADARQRLAFQDHLRRLMRCFDALEQARFPVVAAIQGACVGGALDLAAACDLRVASADAFFAVQEIHIGMAADLGVLQRLPKIVPPGIAREMAFTGERLGAERALAAGLVNAVRPDAEAALAHAMQLAEAIAAKSPLAVAGSKRAINYAIDHPTAEALDQMTLLQSAIFDLGEMGAPSRRGRRSRPAASSRCRR